MPSTDNGENGPVPEVFSTFQVMGILRKDRATVIRWGDSGRIRKVGRMPSGAWLYDAVSVRKAAEKLAEEMRAAAADLEARAAG